MHYYDKCSKCASARFKTWPWFRLKMTKMICLSFKFIQILVVSAHSAGVQPGLIGGGVGLVLLAFAVLAVICWIRRNKKGLVVFSLYYLGLEFM